MKRKIITTADGSKTIQIEDWNEQYHSIHGAVQEAQHVFIKHGLHAVKLNSINILEVGFGTGLNAFITLLEADKNQIKINYTGVEAYPVLEDELAQLNYASTLNADGRTEDFWRLHRGDWELAFQITKNFKLTKQQKFFDDINDSDAYHLVYFDAFGARVQPELWDEAMFKRMYKALKNDGILVTYAAKGSVRRAMQSAGFLVEKLPGPPGKREMLRAQKKRS
ncbi:tRNA (5-methylaminomethyl-2-thiouridine)(34)-methyltransferase MnmD [Paucihalobacter ruber]|uniref:tRNA (5-methylaminomethyl-2-thiouridine)(34)-methyltransferase MnmD n=1 Tax=Paucihalobacter ruber TaxID=2567861 RepID=A0A506PLN4_9FLAO|nr:tRNA (5-methylaminomethyl-2-thiouridine)(34)-methyltransferase MnmD [Paucihalobacter ruber]TPV34027.1 tRNA (5-methylaminomethyl-2-thiouridine)(34)-methyltransferase MnmD [Paucihalobacter ruber]